MSLETDVANLVTKTTDLIAYFNGKKASIDAAVTAAVAAAPAVHRRFYVDQQLGDDAALGTFEAPLKTIDRAVASTPSAGSCEIVLLKDYALESSVAASNRRITIRGDNPQTNTRKLIIKEYLTGTGTKRIGSCQVSLSVSIDLADLTLSLPDTVGGLVAPLDNNYALFFAGGNGIPGFMPIKLYNLAFELRGTFTGKIMGPGWGALAFIALSTTIPSALEGLLIHGVAAGKDPNTIPNLLTNITKL